MIRISMVSLSEAVSFPEKLCCPYLHEAELLFFRLQKTPEKSILAQLTMLD